MLVAPFVLEEYLVRFGGRRQCCFKTPIAELLTGIAGLMREI